VLYVTLMKIFFFLYILKNIINLRYLNINL
jgi:hypothetical protein